MNITKLNSIFETRGPTAALESAKAAMMAGWIIEKLEKGDWDPNYKPAERKSTDIGQPLQRMAPRTGKTARSGGLAASQKRKRERSIADQKLRATMRGGASNKGK